MLSVITPAYNMARYLPDTLDSVAARNPATEWRTTPAVFDWTGDSRGQTEAVNKGLRMAQGDLLAWVNADDAYIPEAVDRALDHLDRHPEVGAIFGGVNYVDDETRAVAIHEAGHAVTSHVYHTTDTTSALYNDGANWVGVCFAVYNGVAAIVAFAIPVLARKTSRRAAHAICLVCGALGLVSIFVITDPKYLLASMVGVGIAWASILSMPYAILAGALPPSKMGYYMGVFNFFIVIPQIVAAALLGFIVGRFFGGQAIDALLIGGLSLVLAAMLTLTVKDDDVRPALPT